MTIAWVFPGQGSQKVGMADAVIDLPGAKDRFVFASQVLGRDLLEICQSNSSASESLHDTRNTQPALFVIESILVDFLKKQGREAAFAAGHSLGEIVALYAAEVLEVGTAIQLLKKRSELMALAGGGAMTAILGFERADLEELVNSTKGVVIANDNSSSQVVLSGTPEAVNDVSSRLQCKRVVPLKVSGAFHSPFMEEASKSFANELDQIDFRDAKFPVLSNADPSPTSSGNLLKERLKKQMTNGVRWRETMNVMENQGVNTIVEIGPGNVLSGLIKRSLKGIGISQISSAADLGY